MSNNVWATAGSATDAIAYTIYYDTANVWNTVFGAQPQAPPLRAESALEWLDRRVNEMCVAL